jgi:hypothetical protein
MTGNVSPAASPYKRVHMVIRYSDCVYVEHALISSDMIGQGSCEIVGTVSMQVKVPSPFYSSNRRPCDAVQFNFGPEFPGNSLQVMKCFY